MKSKIPVIQAETGSADVAPRAHAARAATGRALRGRQVRRVLHVLVEADSVRFAGRRRALGGTAAGDGRRVVGILQHLVPAPGFFQLVLAAEALGGRGHGDPRRRRRILIVVGVQFVHPGQAALLVGVRQCDSGRPSTGAPFKNTHSEHSVRGHTQGPNRVSRLFGWNLCHFSSLKLQLALCYIPGGVEITS